jgi:hypothetical protein
MMTETIRSAFCVSLLMLCCSPAAMSGWLEDTLTDPQDGMLDASDYLASARGFLPVPIIITEPAVGYGLGLAVAYFHAPKELDKEQHPHVGPPSISVGFGAKTENGTYFYGAGHFGVWKEDHVRYLGAIAKMNVNMAYYPDGLLGENVGPEGIGFNIDGGFLLQDVKFRLKESNWWLGGSYMYVDADNTFDLNFDYPIELPKPTSEFNLGALGAYVQYDATNTIFTPTKGLVAKIKYQNFDQSWGSDFNYNHYSGELMLRADRKIPPFT